MALKAVMALTLGSLAAWMLVAVAMGWVLGYAHRSFIAWGQGVPWKRR